MSGFLAVGSFPVASVPAGSLAYSPTSGSIVFSGVTGSASYKIPAIRATWIGLEVSHPGIAKGRVTWVGAETLNAGNPQGRVTWLGVELLRSTTFITTQALVTWFGTEVAHVGVAFARVTWIGIEVVCSYRDPESGGYCCILW